LFCVRAPYPDPPLPALAYARTRARRGLPQPHARAARVRRQAFTTVGVAGGCRAGNTPSLIFPDFVLIF
jgi:hypothetical protein